MTATTNIEQQVDDPTQHDMGPTHRARRGRLGAASAVLALVLGSTACATDDDTTEPADSADAATTDATETTAATESTTPSTSDASASTTAVDDAVAADVLTDTLAGEGVDLFLNLVGIVGLDEITDADEVTLFVPSDEAFTSIEGDELAAIVDDPLIVRDVLESHLVEGAVLSSDLNDGDTVDPVSGESLDVTIDGETVMIGQATVTSADILFDGGVIHIIDDVLVLPEA